MAPPQCGAASEPPKVARIIAEFFAKALHVILDARSRSPCCGEADPYCSTSASSSSRDRWFNLALRELPGALEDGELRSRSALNALIVDVVLSRRGYGSNAQGRSERIIERWTVQYETRSTTESAKSSDPHRKLYKKAILLVRSLYAAVRLLPAHRISQDLRSPPGKARDLCLTHRVAAFAEPFTRAEDAEMDRLAFTPVDMPRGRLCLSVCYLPKLEGIRSVQSSPLPICIIPDYIGSSSADGLKRYQSLPSARAEARRAAFTGQRSLSCNHRASKQHAMHSDRTIRPPANSEARDREQPDNVTASAILTSRPPILDPRIGFSPTECSPARITWSKNTDQVPRCSSPDFAEEAGSTETSGTKTTSCGRISDKRPDILFSPGFQIEPALQKALYLNTLIASSSPVSHNARAFSLPMKYDDADVLFPFATGDGDARTKLSGGKGHAIKHLGSGQLVERPRLVPVGAVVEMLKTASPLHRSSHFPPNTSAVREYEVGDGNQGHGFPDKLQYVPTTSCDSASGDMTTRTTAHALEELRKYKQMKAFLLTQHNINH